MSQATTVRISFHQKAQPVQFCGPKMLAEHKKAPERQIQAYLDLISQNAWKKKRDRNKWKKRSWNKKPDFLSSFLRKKNPKYLLTEMLQIKLETHTEKPLNIRLHLSVIP